MFSCSSPLQKVEFVHCLGSRTFSIIKKSETKAGDGEGRKLLLCEQKKIVELFYDLVGFATFVCVSSVERLGPTTSASNVISDIDAGNEKAGRSMGEASCGWQRIKDRVERVEAREKYEAALPSKLLLIRRHNERNKLFVHVMNQDSRLFPSTGTFPTSFYVLWRLLLASAEIWVWLKLIDWL